MWDLIDYLKIPGITVTMERIILHSPCLPPYFDRVVLEDMFVAMLDEEEEMRKRTRRRFPALMLHTGVSRARIKATFIDRIKMNVGKS